MDLSSYWETIPSLVINKCPVCNDPLIKLKEKGRCPGCNSPARTRSLGPVVKEVVIPLVGGKQIIDKPLLAFAMVKTERELLEKIFKQFKSVSLFGSYEEEHESGVDVRDRSVPLFVK